MQRRYINRTKKILKTAELLDWRARKQLTQERAAKIVGVHVRTYKKAEHGHGVALLTRAKISRAVGVSLKKLELSQ
jgi:DNA-binding XRE family transcriptional regulator